LVDSVVAAADLMTTVRGLAAKLATNAPIAMRYIINAINKGTEMPFAEACQYEATLFGLVASTDDMKEGTAAFLEKRKPQFKGR
jgi:enoyl-CoA hydratase